MSAKVNLVLDDDVKAELERLVASGGRSRVVNQALRRELKRMRRTRAAEALEVLRSKTTGISTADLVADLARDRQR